MEYQFIHNFKHYEASLQKENDKIEFEEKSSIIENEIITEQNQQVENIQNNVLALNYNCNEDIYDIKKDFENLPHISIEYNLINNEYVLNIEIKDFANNNAFTKTFKPDTLDFSLIDDDEKALNCYYYMEQIPELYLKLDNNIVIVYHIIILKINDSTYQLAFNIDQDGSDPFLICEFGHKEQNTYIDISPQSPFYLDDYDYTEDWEIMKYIILFVHTDIIKCSKPLWLLGSIFVSKLIQISSILKVKCYKFSYIRKIISGIFIAGEDLNKLSEKSIDFLLDVYNSYDLGKEELDFQQYIQSNNTNGNLNIITGIYSSDNCFCEKHNIHNINSGAFFCHSLQFNTFTKSSITCLSGIQKIIKLSGNQNVDLLTLLPQGELYIWNCYLKINDFSCHHNSILCIVKYRKGTFNEYECSILLNCDDFSTISAFPPFLDNMIQ